MNIYYVYQYLRKNNSKHGAAGTPFYIGKGKHKRSTANDHYVKVPEEKERIQHIMENLSEKEAFSLETELIAKYGRIDLGTGCLRNRTNGGEGSTGAIRSQKVRELIGNHTRGLVWYWNPETNKQKRATELEQASLAELGWVRGMSPDHRLETKKGRANSITAYNPITNQERKIKSDQASDYKNDGWILNCRKPGFSAWRGRRQSRAQNGNIQKIEK